MIEEGLGRSDVGRQRFGAAASCTRGEQDIADDRRAKFSRAGDIAGSSTDAPMAPIYHIGVPDVGAAADEGGVRGQAGSSGDTAVEAEPIATLPDAGTA